MWDVGGRIGGRWDIGPTNRWEVGDCSPKQVGDERLRPCHTSLHSVAEQMSRNCHVKCMTISRPYVARTWTLRLLPKEYLL